MADHGGVVHRDSFAARQYFLGIAGLALMRRILTRPSEGRHRLEEIRRIVETWDEFPNDIPVEIVEHDVASGYARWAPVYDGPNPAIAAEEPVVRAMVGALPPARALDAACGTGRHAGHLAAQGWDVLGVDGTPAMLEVARTRFPDVEFVDGRLEALPVEDATVDLAVSALALCHAADLVPVFAELSRVVRPGGTVIVSDPHPMGVLLGGGAVFPDPDGGTAGGLTLPFVPNLHHPMHTYVNAAAAAGLGVVECQEPEFPPEALAGNPAYAILPEAVSQAFGGLPFLVVWRFRKPD